MINIIGNSSVFLKPLVITLGVGALIGLLAPFGMNELPLWLSVTVWMFNCAVGFFVYFPILHFANRRLQVVVAQHWVRIAIGAVVASVVMSFIVPFTLVVYSANGASLFDQFANFFPKTLLVGGILTFVGFFREKLDNQQERLVESEKVLSNEKSRREQAEVKPVEAFMRLIPTEKRGRLLCLEMADHYVNVYTDKGNHMVLMRFKDALLALQDYKGMQTHRSWWVACDAIQKVGKEQRKRFLVLTNGINVPVSKTYLETVKAAGFST